MPEEEFTIETRDGLTISAERLKTDPGRPIRLKLESMDYEEELRLTDEDFVRLVKMLLRFDESLREVRWPR